MDILLQMVMYVYFKIQIIWTEIEGSPQILTFTIENDSGKLPDFYFVSFLSQKLKASAYDKILNPL